MKTAFVTCLLLFILMQDASPVPVTEKENYKEILKKVEARKKRSVGSENDCDLYTLVIDLEVRLAKVEEAMAECACSTTEAPGICTAIGVSDDVYDIPDDNMIATSHYLAYYSYNGRLNGESGWCAGSRDEPLDEYLEIDMGALYSVCAVATQGKPSSYIKSYTLSFSTDGLNWSTYQEDGVDKNFDANEDADTIVQNSLGTNQEARFVRFYPTAYHIYPCMRVEIYVMS